MSELENVVAQLCEAIGVEAAIDTTAYLYDALVPGLGDVLRNAWAALRDGGFLALPFAAASSGAADELEYFTNCPKYRRCPECAERHPFFGSCVACEKEHCDCFTDAEESV